MYFLPPLGNLSPMCQLTNMDYPDKHEAVNCTFIYLLYNMFRPFFAATIIIGKECSILFRLCMRVCA